MIEKFIGLPLFRGVGFAEGSPPLVVSPPFRGDYLRFFGEFDPCVWGLFFQHVGYVEDLAFADDDNPIARLYRIAAARDNYLFVAQDCGD